MIYRKKVNKKIDKEIKKQKNKRNIKNQDVIYIGNIYKNDMEIKNIINK